MLIQTTYEDQQLINELTTILFERNPLALCTAILGLYLLFKLCKYILCSMTDTAQESSYKGPGGIDILGGEQKSSLPSKLITGLGFGLRAELSQKEKEKKEPVVIPIAVTKVRAERLLLPHTHSSAILYELEDQDSTSVRSHPNYSQPPFITSTFGTPHFRRTGVYVDTMLANGTYQPPVSGRWRIGSNSIDYIECPALYTPNVTYVDRQRRPIMYNGNTMLVPR